MEPIFPIDNGGCCPATGSPAPDNQTNITALQPPNVRMSDDEPCCGGRSALPSSLHDLPGYRLEPYVIDFMETGPGPVPTVSHKITGRDRRASFVVRWGIGRDHYKVSPGLYACGRPAASSPVVVTANYKLTFDTLRHDLSGTDAWLLVLDTMGINVWCAAGKGTFSTAELAYRIHVTGLTDLASHRRLILPQLAATGVDARKIRKETGFEVVWGPVRSSDLPEFIANGRQATPDMRSVTFSLWERLVLVPVELSALPKPFLLLCAFILLISGIGPFIFSAEQAWSRGIFLIGALLTGILGGAVATPLLLPWLPGRAFSIKGALMGAICGVLLVAAWPGRFPALDAGAAVLLSAAAGSYLGMNFTGATPFTSPSGVEKEMRRAIPLQATGLLATLALWLAAPFA